MMITIKRLSREPLLHLLAIGALLFVLYGLTRDVASEAPKRIVVNGNQIEQLTANFKRTWIRPPTEDELKILVDNYVREEVLYREALVMGLDQNDPLVRQRMRQKLEFILEDFSSEEVTDAELMRFLLENIDKFLLEPQLSFQQVYLNPDTRKNIVNDVEQSLTSLYAGVAAESVGDSILLPAEYKLTTQSEIVRDFGKRFTERLIKLEPSDWQGPFYSGYGAHLVKVTERIDASIPVLADVRKLVEREYLVEKRKQQKELAFQRLRKNYQITIASLNDANGEMTATAQASEAK